MWKLLVSWFGNNPPWHLKHFGVISAWSMLHEKVLDQIDVSPRLVGENDGVGVGGSGGGGSGKQPRKDDIFNPPILKVNSAS